jgi:hypothetical protein
LAAWNGISVSLRNEASELRHNSASSLKEQPLDRRNTKARFSTKMSSSIQNRWRLTGNPEVIHLDVKPAARTFVTEQGEPTIEDQVDEMPTFRPSGKSLREICEHQRVYEHPSSSLWPNGIKLSTSRLAIGTKTSFMKANQTTKRPMPNTSDCREETMTSLSG